MNVQISGGNIPPVNQLSVFGRARRLPRMWLLAVYLIIPICMILMFADMFYFGKLFRKNWSNSSFGGQPWWLLLFGLPHLIAGNLTLLDKEYFSYYRTKLLPAFLAYGFLSFAAAFGPVWLSNSVVLVLSFYTIYHLLAQQAGLCLTMLTCVGRSSKVWKNLMLACGMSLYLAVYLHLQWPQISVASYNPVAISIVIFSILLCLLTYFTRKIQGTAADTVALNYLWANVAMLFGLALAFTFGYFSIVFIIPRVIHDLTAYQIYFNHDANRNAYSRHNILYANRYLKHFPPSLTLTLASIFIAYLLQTYYHPLTVGLVFWLTFIHYYAEGIIWRKPNLHRQHLLLS
ncbi:hypothetical protein ACO0KY_15460 [Undibacterium sp. Dicai25W]|uniref:hypothetical protein n=1 Tax=Undibacterium sp. Dicai25W TaxID=3413034 RepID=UPI003BF12B7E